MATQDPSAASLSRLKPIRRTAVIGAGVMGSGIAAHFANAGLEVLLLDIVPPGLSDEDKKNKGKRNGFSAGGLEKALKARPAAFFHKDNARLVTVGNTEDDLEKLKDCDLVIEAIIEKMEAKQALLAKLEKIVPEHCIVASNTSGLRISEMTKGRSDTLKKHFVVLHFFNPVRYMKLLEIVAGPETDKGVLEHVVHFAQDTLGKGVVFGNDTPNFVGNRIGAHAMMATIHQMLADGLAPEDVDAITGTPMAHPKSASFRTADLVGLDTFGHVADNCYQSLTEDEDRDVFKVPDYIRKMVERKLLGDKTKGGFFKRTPDKQLLTFDPKTLEYRPKGGDEAIKATTKTLSKIEDPKERIKKLVADQGKAGDFARKVLYRSLAYSARRVGEITDSVQAIDDAMRWGYSWELGPFEAWDALGFAETVDAIEKAGHKLPESIKKMKASGATAFYKDGPNGKAEWSLKKGEYVQQKQDPRYRTLAQTRKGDKPVLKNDGAEAWDLGDGVLGLTFKTKANSIDPDVISMIHQATERAERDFRGMVLVNEGEHFCVGANLLLVVMNASQGQFEPIREMVKSYQYSTQRMKYARVPVVAAPYGMTLGGGLELCFGTDAVQAAAETYSGLVEVAVGLIPGGAGTLNMLWRALEGIPEGANVNTYEYV
ncbi:MAG TPA: 3-hydroxyacyl-CoA dehydrogenase/enoyl-CoA hydratase family protein, partial [Labilithrix sp.]|nr:3-hydroxyacyl-CoA dehydrogenase/enoyl-CoA hydratase family protein [Labilithrix sp.]